LKEELKDHKEDLEYEVENIKEHNPDYIKSAQVKVKALDGEIKEMKEHLKDGNKNASAKYGGTVVVNPKEVAEHRWSIHDISDW
jgi:F0F1-type ATP synthase membrane subunit b/b'